MLQFLNSHDNIIVEFLIFVSPYFGVLNQLFNVEQAAQNLTDESNYQCCYCKKQLQYNRKL